MQLRHFIAVFAIVLMLGGFGHAAPVPYAWFKADTIGIANGAAVSNWDNSASADDATAVGGTPLYNTGTAASNFVSRASSAPERGYLKV